MHDVRQKGKAPDTPADTSRRKRRKTDYVSDGQAGDDVELVVGYTSLEFDQSTGPRRSGSSSTTAQKKGPRALELRKEAIQVDSSPPRPHADRKAVQLELASYKAKYEELKQKHSALMLQRMTAPEEKREKYEKQTQLQFEKINAALATLRDVVKDQKSVIDTLDAEKKALDDELQRREALHAEEASGLRRIIEETRSFTGLKVDAANGADKLVCEQDTPAGVLKFELSMDSVARVQVPETSKHAITSPNGSHLSMAVGSSRDTVNASGRRSVLSSSAQQHRGMKPHIRYKPSSIDPAVRRLLPPFLQDEMWFEPADCDMFYMTIIHHLSKGTRKEAGQANVEPEVVSSDDEVEKDEPERTKAAEPVEPQHPQPDPDHEAFQSAEEDAMERSPTTQAKTEVAEKTLTKSIAGGLVTTAIKVVKEVISSNGSSAAART